jgi:hypothetical protein
LIEAQAGTGSNSGFPAFVFSGRATILFLTVAYYKKQFGENARKPAVGNPAGQTERLPFRIGVKLGRDAVREIHWQIVFFKPSQEFIEELLRGRGQACIPTRIGLDESPCLVESQYLFEFLYNVHSLLRLL